MFSRLRRQLREVGGMHGLSPSQTSVLSRLTKAGAMTASELAAVERVRPQSMAATVAVLDEQGLIERAPDPADGRRQLITLSAQGRRTITGSRQARAAWLSRAIEDRCSEAERATLVEAIALLERIAEP